MQDPSDLAQTLSEFMQSVIVREAPARNRNNAAEGDQSPPEENGTADSEMQPSHPDDG